MATLSTSEATLISIDMQRLEQSTAPVTPSPSDEAMLLGDDVVPAPGSDSRKRGQEDSGSHLYAGRTPRTTHTGGPTPAADSTASRLVNLAVSRMNDATSSTQQIGKNIVSKSSIVNNQSNCSLSNNAISAVNNQSDHNNGLSIVGNQALLNNGATTMPPGGTSSVNPNNGMTQQVNNGASTSSNNASAINNAQPRPVKFTEGGTQTSLQSLAVNQRLTLTEEQAGFFRRLRNAQEKVMRYKLHREFLLKYHAAGVVPKGLVVKCAPYLGAADASIDQAWMDTLHAASLRLLELTVQRVNKTLDELNTQWVAIITEIENNGMPDNIKVSIVQKVSDLIDIKKNQMVAVKNGKWTRDTKPPGPQSSRPLPKGQGAPPAKQKKAENNSTFQWHHTKRRLRQNQRRNAQPMANRPKPLNHQQAGGPPGSQQAKMQFVTGLISNLFQ